jgi:hypothetical protein
MLRIGATITTEVWGDQESKPNLDWNHAWATAPANIIARRILGVSPLLPGFAKVLIRPNPAGLSGDVYGKVPTIRGPIEVRLSSGPSSYTQRIVIPANCVAQVWVPHTRDNSALVQHNGNAVTGLRRGEYSVFDSIGSGEHLFSISGNSSHHSTTKPLLHEQFSVSHSVHRQGIIFELSSSTAITYRIHILNLCGRKVHTLQGALTGGRSPQQVIWRTASTSTMNTSPGMYLALVEAGRYTRKILLPLY